MDERSHRVIVGQAVQLCMQVDIPGLYPDPILCRIGNLDCYSHLSDRYCQGRTSIYDGVLAKKDDLARRRSFVIQIGGLPYDR